MELRQLRYFVAVAEELHFGRAAFKLRIAQSGLSQQIKALERSLGVQLFARDERHVELTEAGETLLEHARLLTELVDRAVEETRGTASGAVGVIRVGTNASGAYVVANEIISEFRSRYPEARVDVSPGFTPNHLDALGRSQIDVAFLSEPFDLPPGSRFLRLGTLELLLAIPECHPLAELERIPREAIAAETFLGYPRNVSPAFVDHVRRVVFGDTAPHRFDEASDTLARNWLLQVADGKGFTAMPLGDRPPGDLIIPGVAYRRLEDPVPLIHYGIAWLEPALSPHALPFEEIARMARHFQRAADSDADAPQVAL